MNEYLDLPDDPEEAFAELHKRAYARLEEVWDDSRGGNTWYYERRYIDELLAFDEVHQLGYLTAYLRLQAWMGILESIFKSSGGARLLPLTSSKWSKRVDKKMGEKI